jgi:hypothetical protein
LNAPEFVTCVAENPVMLAKGASVAESPHESADAIKRTSFEDASPTPVICRSQDVVNVHCVAPVKGPEIWNAPMSNR